MSVDQPLLEQMIQDILRNQRRLEALESQEAGGGDGGAATLAVVNNSGGAVVAGDVGLLRQRSGGGLEYYETTTEAAPGLWCVVETGGANGASIAVYRSGEGITVNYTGGAPSAGDFLTTSTTAGAAVGRTTMHANIFARCSANGAGGQVEATLLCNTLFVPNVASQRIIGVSGHADTDFVATINGAPNATTVVYNAPSSGNENVIDPDAATHLGRMVLFNSTRGTERLIVDTNTGTNTITTENSADAWANGDTITIRSQTVTGVGPPYMIDVDLSLVPAGDLDPLARAMLIKVTEQETGTVVAGFSYTVTHPYETFNNNKQITVLAQISTQFIAVHSVQVLIEQRFCWRADANGAATCGSYMDSLGYFVAAP